MAGSTTALFSTLPQYSWSHRSTFLVRYKKSKHILYRLLQETLVQNGLHMVAPVARVPSPAFQVPDQGAVQMARNQHQITEQRTQQHGIQQGLSQLPQFQAQQGTGQLSNSVVSQQMTQQSVSSGLIPMSQVPVCLLLLLCIFYQVHWVKLQCASLNSATGYLGILLNWVWFSRTQLSTSPLNWAPCLIGPSSSAYVEAKLNGPTVYKCRASSSYFSQHTPSFPIFSNFLLFFLFFSHFTCNLYLIYFFLGDSFQLFQLFFLSGAHQLFLKIFQPHFLWHYFKHIYNLKRII